MFSIRLDDYGVEITWDGGLTPEEAQERFAELEGMLGNYRGGMGVLVDLRAATLPAELPPDIGEMIVRCQEFLRERGMGRTAVVLTDAAHHLRLRRIAARTGILQDERYIDPRRNPNWRRDTRRWIVDGIEPGGQWPAG